MSWSNIARKGFIALAALAAATLILAAVTRDAASGLQAVRERGELVVAMRQGPATYFYNAFGPGGFEYELAASFADELGVRLNVVPVSSHREALDLLARGEVDIAAGEALDDALEARGYALSIPVQSITQLLVCNRDVNARDPDKARQSILSGKPLLVAAGSHHAAQLDELRELLPALSYREIENAGDEYLLGLVHEEQAGCAVMDANAWEFHRHLYHDLMVTAELPEPTYFGWLQRRAGDSALRQAANAYLARRQANGDIAALRDRHFSHVQSLTGVDSKRFYQAIRSKLPRYADAFRREADRNGIDWRLLAAVAYQESLWDPAAQSPTGVQGLMQLTLDTAMQLGIADRTDPLSSIRGGALYLRQVLDQLPASVPEPDRTWMALAAYNAGLAHVLDARRLAGKRGGNPDSWPDVRANLALLKQPKWYSQTRYGYARGATQAIIYVRHVRRYYDLLVLASNSSNDRLMLAMGGKRADIVN
jgi:membrane-bound lytic murein transglycosylase F